jgi:SAM-dependent methyltransferase
MVNPSRVHLYNYNKDFASKIPENALVLDAGAGIAPYRDLFRQARYESADFELVDKEYAKSTYVCDLSSIPVEDERFDFVIFNQTLEHVPEPCDVLRELNRVLKPGGRMICTAPLFYEEHEQPYDFYRYTQFAYRHMLAKTGFTIESIDWLEGYVGTVAYQLKTAAKYLPIKPGDVFPGALGFVLSPLFGGLKISFRVLAAIMAHIDTRAPYKKRGFPKNYIVIAVKEQAKEQAAAAKTTAAGRPAVALAASR